MENQLPAATNASEATVNTIRDELSKSRSSKTRRIVEKFVLAVLGAIPWVGGLIAAAASIRGEEATTKSNELQTKWLEEHEQKFVQLHTTLDGIYDRFESLGPEIDERIQSPEYLALV